MHQLLRLSFVIELNTEASHTEISALTPPIGNSWKRHIWIDYTEDWLPGVGPVGLAWYEVSSGMMGTG